MCIYNEICRQHALCYQLWEEPKKKLKLEEKEDIWDKKEDRKDQIWEFISR